MAENLPPRWEGSYLDGNEAVASRGQPCLLETVSTGTLPLPIALRSR